MALFAIGDLHLSTLGAKPMDIFPGWQDHARRLCDDWRGRVSDDDTVVLAGDTSWGMTLDEAAGDFALIDSLPGKKVILKGNHDYWWNSRRKIEEHFAKNGLKTLSILHNSCVAAEGVAICGTRGWMFDEDTAHDQKLIAREEGRLRTSLEEGKKTGLEIVAFLHYPPLYGDFVSFSTIDLLRQYGVKRCFYGHIHGPAARYAVQGEQYGIEFALIAADYLRFRLKKL